MIQSPSSQSEKIEKRTTKKSGNITTTTCSIRQVRYDRTRASSPTWLRSKVQNRLVSNSAISMSTSSCTRQRRGCIRKQCSVFVHVLLLSCLSTCFRQTSIAEAFTTPPSKSSKNNHGRVARHHDAVTLEQEKNLSNRRTTTTRLPALKNDSATSMRREPRSSPPSAKSIDASNTNTDGSPKRSSEGKASNIPSHLPSLSDVLSASKQSDDPTSKAKLPSLAKSSSSSQRQSKSKGSVKDDSNNKQLRTSRRRRNNKVAAGTPNKKNKQMTMTLPKRNGASSSKQHQQQKPPLLPTRGPWLAPYATSRQTQQRIQDMGSEKTQHWAPLRRASAVLQTLLDTPTEHCNAANLVCALTLSAKLRGDNNNGSSSSSSSSNQNNKNVQETTTLRRLLWRTLQVLKQVNAANQLSARQISNAAWAIAKHYDRDALLLPEVHQPTVLSSPNHFGTAETWTLSAAADDSNNAEKDVQAQIMVNQLVEELASSLASMLKQDPWIAKEGELCMACWAYGVLRERKRPAGWKVAPQLGAVESAPEDDYNGGDNINNQRGSRRGGRREEPTAIKFEQWQGPVQKTGEEFMSFDPPEPTDELLDQIALALCQPVLSSQTDKSNRKAKTATLSSPIRLQTCRWSELANIAYAHASHGWSSSAAAEGVLLALASEAGRRLHNPAPGQQRPLSRDMAQLVWSMGILQTDNFHLTSGLVELLKGVAAYTRFMDTSVRRPFADWSCPDIVQVPLALAHARIDDQDLLREMYAEALRRVSTSVNSSSRGRNLHTWEISILLWAQARLHLTREQGDVFEAFPSVAMDYLLAAAEQEGGWGAIGIEAQEQANLVWSMTVLERFRANKEVRLLQELFLASQEDCRENGVIQLEHAHQLWQALFLLEEEAPLALKGVQSWFRDVLEAKWVQEKSRPKVSSARHRALSNVLVNMGVAHFNEHDEDIDVAIVLKRAASWTHETDRMSLDGGVRVAVEFDGPNHFTRILDPDNRAAPRPLGHSILKYRLLKRQGWTVVRVPYYEFDRIPFWASMERQRYVQRLLKTHSDLRFSSVDVSEYSPPVANRKSRFQ